MDRDRPTGALLALTFATGVIDAASFLALGGVFAAMQTGNVIFLGLGIAGADSAPLLAPLIGLVAFLTGSVAAAAALRSPQPQSQAVTLRRWLVLEAALLVLAATLAALLDVSPGQASAYCLIALLSLTMGLRNTTIRGSAGPNLATTVLNLTLTTIQLGAPPTPAGEADLRERAAGFLAILAGAIAGALLVQTSLPLALTLAAATTVGTTFVRAPRRPRTI